MSFSVINSRLLISPRAVIALEGDATCYYFRMSFVRVGIENAWRSQRVTHHHSMSEVLFELLCIRDGCYSIDFEDNVVIDY